MNVWLRVAGWVLIHFVWQGGALAFAAAVGLRFSRSHSSTVRYAIACASLAAMLAAPMITAFFLASSASIETLVVAPTAGFLEDSPLPPTGQTLSEPGSNTRRFIPSNIESIFPVIVSLWLLGVVLLLGRTGGCWYRVRRLQRIGLAAPPSDWQNAAKRAATLLGLQKVIHVVALGTVDVPTVVGWLRPVIILPVAALSHLTPAEIEAILAHELAHIRRNDYLVNVLQTLVETVLFYHPGVWWVSARIREEREHCCDDLAIQVSGDAVGYATALTELETWRTSHSALELAATGGSLLRRVRRILRVPISDQPQAPSWALMLALTAVFALGAGGLQRSPTVIAQASSIVAEAFRSRWSGPGGSGSVRSEGSIVFAEDLSDVKSMATDGFLSVESGFFSSRRVEIRAADSTVTRRYFVDGAERPWDDEARTWLAAELPFFVRRSGLAANDRVSQIITTRGVSGVLSEIQLLYTDSVRGRYFRALFGARRLNAQELDSALTLAGQLISSSVELSETLRALLTTGPLENGNAFFGAVGHISSSAEKRRVLMALLDQPGLSRPLQRGLLRAAGDIESNAACANVLYEFATRYSVSDQGTREAFLAALETVDSQAERNRVLARVVSGAR